MTTLASVNKALKKAGIDAELVKGKGYYWFDGDEASGWYSNSVPVFHVSQLSEEQWIAAYHSLKEDSDKRRGVSSSAKPVKAAPGATDPKDIVSMNAPLLIRLLELAREDLKTDVQLHLLAEDILSVSKEGRPLSMSDYDRITRRAAAPTAVQSSLKITFAKTVLTASDGPTK